MKKIAKAFNGKEEFPYRQFQLKAYSVRLMHTLKLWQKIFNDCVKSGNFPDILDIILFL